MPQSSTELRTLMRRWFGNISDSGPTEFLYSHGFTLTPSFDWLKPTPAHNCSEDECFCLAFLVEEWDYGYVVNVAPPPTEIIGLYAREEEEEELDAPIPLN